jgi:hypothetical protein
MTRSRYRIFETEYPYFMTCTIVGWLPVFTRPEAVQIVFDCWRFLGENKGFVLYGYVVLENHPHLVASAPELPNVMRSFKMYIARQILELLERQGPMFFLGNCALTSWRIRSRATTRYGRKESGQGRFGAVR